MQVIVRGGLIGLATGIILLFFTTHVSAARFSSTNYVIDASVMNNFGRQGSSANYTIVGSGGESIIGNGAGGSYRLGAGFAAQLEHGITLSIQPTGLSGHFALDESVMPTIYDSSVANINGTANANPSSAAGKLGSSLSFNGTSQLINIGSTSSFTGSSFTLEAWVKSSSSTGIMAAVSKSSNFWLGVNNGKAAIYDWTAGAFCSAAAAPAVTDNNWHHLAVTLSSGTTNGSIIYIDGIQQQTCTWTPVAQNGEVGIAAAKAASWQQFFNGNVDNVKIFNRILSSAEIKAEYDAQNSGNQTGISIGTVIAGTSISQNYDAIMQSDAGGYALAVNQSQNLTSGANTIPGVSGTIASPSSWSEGTTKGLGFTLTNTNASAIPGKWGGGSAYAAFPASATTFYSRSGYSGGARDYLSVRLRLDVAAQQASGQYQNTVITTGTIIP